MIGTTSKGRTHSSLIPYFSRKSGFWTRSRSAQKSSGESLGTLVTIPVPFFSVTESIGSVYTVGYLASGAESGRPMSSAPVRVVSELTSPSIAIIS